MDTDRGHADSVEKVEEAARLLCAVRIGARAIDNLPAPLRPADLDASYRVQDYLNGRLAAAGFGHPIGYKIGCTTAVMQDYLGIPHPCVGRMFASTVKRRHGEFDRSDLCRPGVECEIAVQIDRDMAADRIFAAGDCDDFVRSAFASIELVDSRWTDYAEVATPALVAENFFNAGCVLGQPLKASGADLKDAVGTIRINGEPVGSGSGADILGHPYEALAWLANHLAGRGSALRAGDIVSLGSVVQTHWIGAGDRVEIEFTTLDGCSLQLN